MKNIFLLAFALVTLNTTAQVADTTVTDCNANTNSIYAVLASGKPLIIASKGFDCSNCKSTAAALQTWASQNKSDVEVWGAMTFTYSGNTPTCTNVSSWVSTYSWTDIFTFLDSGRHWFKNGTPRYYVYDPADSTIAYEGNRQATALSTASSLVSSVSVDELKQPKFLASGGDGLITLFNIPEASTIEVMSLTGQVVERYETLAPAKTASINIYESTPQIYVVRLNSAGAAPQQIKVLVQ